MEVPSYFPPHSHQLTETIRHGRTPVVPPFTRNKVDRRTKGEIAFQGHVKRLCHEFIVRDGSDTEGEPSAGFCRSASQEQSAAVRIYNGESTADFHILIEQCVSVSLSESPTNWINFEVLNNRT